MVPCRSAMMERWGGWPSPFERACTHLDRRADGNSMVMSEKDGPSPLAATPASALMKAGAYRVICSLPAISRRYPALYRRR